MSAVPTGVAIRRACAEGLGTYFLVLIGPGAVMVNAYTGGALGPVGIGLAFAWVVLVMILSLGHLSGAHINPAVTIAFWSIHRFPAREVLPYIAAQCAGAVLAAFTLKLLMGSIGAMGATLPHVGIGRSFLVEWLFSFVLMFVIMAVATDERVADGFAATAIGLTVGFCALLGSMTGSSMNPARSLGPAIAGGGWQGHWLYWVAPITGMLAAAQSYEFLRVTRTPSVPERLGVQGDVSPTRD